MWFQYIANSAHIGRSSLSFAYLIAKFKILTTKDKKHARKIHLEWVFFGPSLPSKVHVDIVYCFHMLMLHIDEVERELPALLIITYFLQSLVMMSLNCYLMIRKGKNSLHRHHERNRNLSFACVTMESCYCHNFLSIFSSRF